MKVAILEYICGSGVVRAKKTDDEAHPWTALLDEGHAMLSALARDMIDAGIDVHCPLESSIARWGRWRSWDDSSWSWSAIPFDDQRSTDEVANLWIDSLEGCDAVIVIAPELDGTMTRIIARLRSTGISVLAGDEPFLSTTCDQWRTCQAWQATGVRHPKTWLLSEFDPREHLQTRNHGWVIKRRDSAGCVGQRRFEDARSVADYAAGCKKADIPTELWVVQPWVAGRAASLATVVGEDIRVLGAFEQHFQSMVENGEPAFGYSGGSGPVPGISEQALQRFASEVLAAIPGRPRGWVGIDFVIEPDGPLCAIEVNSRLTTSYLGYRQWYGHRIAERWVRVNSPLSEPKDFATVCFSVDHFEG